MAVSANETDAVDKSVASVKSKKFIHTNLPLFNKLFFQLWFLF